MKYTFGAASCYIGKDENGQYFQRLQNSEGDVCWCKLVVLEDGQSSYWQDILNTEDGQAKADELRKAFAGFMKG